MTGSRYQLLNTLPRRNDSYKGGRLKTSAAGFCRPPHRTLRHLNISAMPPQHSGRLDSNQRPPEPHLRVRGRLQSPNVTNASLLETYSFYSSHSLRKSQPKIKVLPTFSRL